MKNYLTFINEVEIPKFRVRDICIYRSDENAGDSLSGTIDIKINVIGGKSLISRLINNMSLLVRKRTSKTLRIKSISGYFNKEILSIYYETHLEIDMTNKDFIVAEYKSISNNITIKINNEIVYDMINKSFDNEFLLDKIISEYKKYLRANKFIINEIKIMEK